MRILYDSKQPQFKTPFGTLTPGQVCTLHIHIPTSVLTTKVTCVFNHEDGSWAQNAVLAFQMKKGAYDVFEGQFSIPCPGLFFYYFVIDTQGGSFRLFKQGDDTNMEAGDLWQLSPPTSPPRTGRRAQPSIRFSPTVFTPAEGPM